MRGSETVILQGTYLIVIQLIFVMDNSASLYIQKTTYLHNLCGY